MEINVSKAVRETRGFCLTRYYQSYIFCDFCGDKLLLGIKGSAKLSATNPRIIMLA